MMSVSFFGLLLVLLLGLAVVGAVVAGVVALIASSRRDR
jgi:hypothetical protein